MNLSGQQDGTILDGVLLWQQNLDRHFEGVECCPICYSLFHISDHSLPRLACKTCHNKFHSACMVPSSTTPLPTLLILFLYTRALTLPRFDDANHTQPQYKWIRVSHNTDCPLCKTPFN